jgi:hypothetical protein
VFSPVVSSSNGLRSIGKRGGLRCRRKVASSRLPTRASNFSSVDMGRCIVTSGSRVGRTPWFLLGAFLLLMIPSVAFLIESHRHTTLWVQIQATEFSVSNSSSGQPSRYCQGDGQFAGLDSISAAVKDPSGRTVGEIHREAGPAVENGGYCSLIFNSSSLPKRPFYTFVVGHLRPITITWERAQFGGGGKLITLPGASLR